MIPVYKIQPDDYELASLKRCLTILGKHPVIFISPESLKTDVYEEVCSGRVLFQHFTFNDRYFESIEGYNELMLSPGFYKKFLEYTFILIYQLDAYVFKDELDLWCRQNYDYIGAPNIAHENQAGEIQFLKGYMGFVRFINRLFRTNHKISNVGNGGFSLRKTHACYLLVRLLRKRVKYWGINNEDGFFKYWGNLLYPIFRLPTDDIALRFSIEHSPQKSIQKLGGNLPFGCHAFQKNDWRTWQQFINISK